MHIKFLGSVFLTNKLDRSMTSSDLTYTCVNEFTGNRITSSWLTSFNLKFLIEEFCLYYFPVSSFEIIKQFDTEQRSFLSFFSFSSCLISSVCLFLSRVFYCY